MNKLFFGIEVEGVMVNRETGLPVPMSLVAPHKDEPHVLEAGELVHADCSGAETASIPSSDAKEVLSSIQRGFDWWAAEYPHLDLKIIPVADYEEDDLHHDDWIIGCSPSVCVWEGVPPTPTKYKDSSRCYGLHITFDLPDNRLNKVEEITKSLDYLLALWCQENSPYPELDKKRRNIGYGRPGEIRKKFLRGKCMIEYRTLPNWAYIHIERFQAIIEKLVYDDQFLNETVKAYSEDRYFWKKLISEGDK